MCRIFLFYQLMLQVLSFKNYQPDWSLLNQEDISELPAVNWKLLNLKKMPQEKHTKALEALRRVLYST